MPRNLLGSAKYCFVYWTLSNWIHIFAKHPFYPQKPYILVILNGITSLENNKDGTQFVQTWLIQDRNFGYDIGPIFVRYSAHIVP